MQEGRGPGVGGDADAGDVTTVSTDAPTPATGVVRETEPLPEREAEPAPEPERKPAAEAEAEPVEEVLDPPPADPPLQPDTDPTVEPAVVTTLPVGAPDGEPTAPPPDRIFPPDTVVPTDPLLDSPEDDPGPIHDPAAPAEDDPFPHTSTRAAPAPRPAPPAGLLAATGAAWLLALAGLRWNPVGSGAITTVAELLAWLAAVALAVVTAAAWRLPVAAVAAVGALATAVAVACCNWSGLEPRTYFALHRPLFAAVGDRVRDGDLDGAPGARHALPVPLRPVSAGGAVVAGGDARTPAVLLPQQGTGGEDGYVYYDGDPAAHLVVDLGDRTPRLVDGLYLGGGWWWV